MLVCSVAPIDCVLRIILGIYLGAGLQSKSRLDQYCQTIKRACLNATKAMNNGKDAAEAVCIAVAVLEVNPSRSV